MSVLLKDLMGTKYIINTLDYRLQPILEQLKDCSDDVDLCYCRFGPKCASMIEKYYGKINFINTEDSELNQLLQKNREIATTEKEEYPELRISDLVVEDYFQAIKDVPAGKYKIVLNVLYPIERHIARLLLMQRPDIEFDCADTTVTHDVLKDVATMVHRDEYYHYDKIIEVSYSQILIKDINEANFNTPNVFYLPYSFGTEVLVDPFAKPKPKVKKEYRDCLNYTLDNIDKYFNVYEENYIDIFSFLKTKEGYNA